MPNPCQQKVVNVHPYASSVASSASSSSSSSVFSLDGVSSQSSIFSTSTHGADVIWEHEALGEGAGRVGPLHTSSCEPAGRGARIAVRASSMKPADAPVPPELRMHPRRTASSHGISASGPRHPPPLVRQNERKINFVDNLVGKSHFWKEDVFAFSTLVAVAKPCPMIRFRRSAGRNNMAALRPCPSQRLFYELQRRPAATHLYPGDAAEVSH